MGTLLPPPQSYPSKLGQQQRTQAQHSAAWAQAQHNMGAGAAQAAWARAQHSVAWARAQRSMGAGAAQRSTGAGAHSTAWARAQHSKRWARAQHSAAWTQHISKVPLSTLDRLWSEGYFDEPLQWRLGLREFGTSIGRRYVYACASGWLCQVHGCRKGSTLALTVHTCTSSVMRTLGSHQVNT